MKTLSKFIFLSTILFFLVGVAYSQDMNPDAAKLYNEGNSLLKEGNYTGAIKNYDEALNIEKDYRIYYQKGVALKKSGKLEEAKNSFEEVVKENPDFEAGYNALGGVYFSMGNYEAAVNNFEKVVKNSENNNIKSKVQKNLALAYAKLGNDALTNGNPQKAIDYLTSAVNNHDYDAAYLSLAKVYSEMGEYDKSIDAAQNALKHRSSIGKGGPYYYLGIAYKNKDQIDKAKEMFNAAKSDASYRKLSEYELSAMR